MTLLSRGAAALPDVPLPGLTWAARRWIRSSFGAPPVGAEGPAGDAGLLGADSASWRLFADAASIVGGIRSLLMQLTHPLAVAGVARHSRYADDPLGRLRDTSAYVALTTFGSSEEALRVIARVRAAHRSVRGRLADGRAYDAADPELLTWVSVAATDSWLASDRALAARPLDQEGRDRYVDEQARIAALLDPRVDLGALHGPDAARVLATDAAGLPLIADGWLPTTETALRERLDWFRPRLAVGDDGRDTLRFMLWPPVGPALRLGYLPTLAGALALLEPWTRRLLGLPLPPLVDGALRLNAEVALVALRRGLAAGSPNAEAARRRVTSRALG